MANSKNIPIVTEIPKQEQVELDKLIKTYRTKYIRSSQVIVDKVFNENESFLLDIKQTKVSDSIAQLREIVWSEYLKDEVHFNVLLMQHLYKLLKTPKHILDSLLTNDLSNLNSDNLKREIINICGEYAGRVYPYIYKISLSNTNSRRSRAGKTFEAIIYKVYETLGYSYDSQGKVGRKTFTELGLGKKVDSILPSIKAYEKRRNKTIVGTMKTSLRERWQEVAEEKEIKQECFSMLEEYPIKLLVDIYVDRLVFDGFLGFSKIRGIASDIDFIGYKNGRFKFCEIKEKDLSKRIPGFGMDTRRMEDISKLSQAFNVEYFYVVKRVNNQLDRKFVSWYVIEINEFIKNTKYNVEIEGGAGMSNVGSNPTLVCEFKYFRKI